VHELALGAAFIAGLMGSMHCMAMCGGLTTAFGVLPSGGLRWQPLVYQFGRIASYGLAGSIAGTAGAVAGAGFETSHWGAVLRVGTALLIVLIGLNLAVGSGSQARWLRVPERWGARLWRRVVPTLRARLPREPTLRALTLGMLWGWLPCGLVYSVLLIAAFSGSAVRGGATMMAFGLGTLPALLGLSYLSTRWLQRRNALARILGAVVVACGLWTAAMPIAELTGTHQHSGTLAASASYKAALPR
jgi:hypothetical protein